MSPRVAYRRIKEREFFIGNLLVRIHLIIEMILVAREILNSLFQIALYLPCQDLTRINAQVWSDSVWKRCISGRGWSRREKTYTSRSSSAERDFFLGNLLVRIHLIIEMISEDRRCAKPQTRVTGRRTEQSSTQVSRLTEATPRQVNMDNWLKLHSGDVGGGRAQFLRFML